MNLYQKVKLSAYKLIVAEAKKALATISKVAKFLKGINDVDEICNKIEELQAQQEKDNTGIAGNFNLLKNVLIELMAIIAGGLQSFANEISDKELIKRVNFTKNSLSGMEKQIVIANCSILIEEVEKRSAEELAAEGISATDVSELKRLFAEVKQKQQAPQLASINKRIVTNKIKKLFEDANEIKKHTLDPLARQFKIKDPDFYQRYILARKIVYKKTTHKTDGGAKTFKNGNDTTIGTEK